MSTLTFAQTVDIGYGRGRLAPDAAASVRRIDAELGRPLDVNSAWRDPELQDRMYRAWVAYLNGGPKPNHGRALPSWSSVHCKGFAIDTDDTGLGRVLNDHGWYRTASDEPWHYEYFPNRDNHRNQPAGTQEEDDMFSDEDRKMLQSVRDAIFFGGKSMHDDGKPLAQSVAEIQEKVGPILRPGPDGVKQPVSLRQEVADAKTGILQLLGRPAAEVKVDIDEAEIAAELAPLLTDFSRLSDADVKRIAKAAADERDRRERERLG